MAAIIDLATVPDDRQLTIRRLLDAPRELVFEVWTTAEHVARWWKPKDFVVDEAQWDFREGGAWRVVMSSPEHPGVGSRGVFREIDPPGRIVLTFRWDRSEGDYADTVITVTFEARGDKTLLTFHHAPFESVEQRDSHDGGWSSVLDAVAAYLAERTGASR